MKKKFFFDACSLIYLTKINMKEKLPLLGITMIGPIVEKELTSEPNKFNDAKKLKSNIKKGIIKQIKPKEEIHSSFPNNLGDGEKECINLSILKGGFFITDDHKALNYAIIQGLKPKTSEYILLDFLDNGIINYEEFKRVFKMLADIKLLNTKMINFIKNKAKKIIKSKKFAEDKKND